MPILPSHASPVLASHVKSSLLDASSINGDVSSTPPLPPAIVSPNFTPPTTPRSSGQSTPLGHKARLKQEDRPETKTYPVDTAYDEIFNGRKAPRLVQHLPQVECIVRARIPTVISGADMFLHLYHNDVDDKEHLAIVFGTQIRSQSLEKVRDGETEMDRMIRGAYTGRLRPGRVSSWVDKDDPQALEVMEGDATCGHSALEDVSKKPSTGTDGLNGHACGGDQSSRVKNQQAEQRLEPVLVRIHSECYTGETAWSARCDCGEQLDEAARIMSSHGDGVIVYLRQEGRGIGLSEKLKAYNLQDLGSDTVEANLLLRHPADARSYGLATAILQDLGCGGDRGIKLLTNNPDKIRAVEGPHREIRVRERVAMVPLAWRSSGKEGIQSSEIEQYLGTKIAKMGHVIQG